MFHPFVLAYKTNFEVFVCTSLIKKILHIVRVFKVKLSSNPFFHFGITAPADNSISLH